MATACGGGGGGGGDDSSSPPAANPAPPAPAPVPAPSGPFQSSDPELVVESIEPTVSALPAAVMDCNNNTTNGTAAFDDITQTAGLCYPTVTDPSDSGMARISGGIAIADYDGDGYLDVYASQGRNNPGRLFRQQSDNRFTETTTSAGITTTSVARGGAFVDVDMDGLPDLISIQEAPDFLQIFSNNGDGTFSEISDSTGITFTKGAFSAAAGDYDLDGDLDLMFGHWDNENVQNRFEYLWQNQGDSTYDDVSVIAEIGLFNDPTMGPGEQLQNEYSFTPIFADINSDRYPDVVMASDFTTSQVLINSSGTSLIDTTDNVVISDRSGMGASVADYDNDGDLDWFVSAAAAETIGEYTILDGNRLYQNDGTGTFTDVTSAAGVREGFWGWGTCFGDFNNDGHLDIFLVNGYHGLTEQEVIDNRWELYVADPARLYVSNGNGTFTERSTELGILHTAEGRGLACYDYDRDGDLDMMISNSGSAPTLYRNNNFAAGNNFLSVRLEGNAPNPQAVGARIYITVNGEERFTELQLGNNYLSHNPVEAHFGLGTADRVERVRVVWPGLAADESELTDVMANQFLVIHQPEN